MHDKRSGSASAGDPWPGSCARGRGRRAALRVQLMVAGCDPDRAAALARTRAPQAKLPFGVRVLHEMNVRGGQLFGLGTRSAAAFNAFSQNDRDSGSYEPARPPPPGRKHPSLLSSQPIPCASAWSASQHGREVSSENHAVLRLNIRNIVSPIQFSLKTALLVWKTQKGLYTMILKYKK